MMSGLVPHHAMGACMWSERGPDIGHSHNDDSLCLSQRSRYQIYVVPLLVLLMQYHQLAASVLMLSLLNYHAQIGFISQVRCVLLFQLNIIQNKT